MISNLALSFSLWQNLHYCLVYKLFLESLSCFLISIIEFFSYFFIIELVLIMQPKPQNQPRPAKPLTNIFTANHRNKCCEEWKTLSELIVISDICKNTHIVRNDYYYNDMFCVLSEYHTGTIVQVKNTCCTCVLLYYR